MSPTDFQLDASERLKNLCFEVFGSRINAYFIGTPNILIPEAAMPCIVIQKTNGTVRLGATGQDKVGDQINIHLLMNSKDDLGTDFAEDTTMRKAQLMIEGVDKTTGGYHESTLLYRLRREITLGQLGLDQEVDTDYDIIPRLERSNIVQATVQVVMRRNVIVPSRV